LKRKLFARIVRLGEIMAKRRQYPASFKANDLIHQALMSRFRSTANAVSL